MARGHVKRCLMSLITTEARVTATQLLMRTWSRQHSPVVGGNRKWHTNLEKSLLLSYWSVLSHLSGAAPAAITNHCRPGHLDNKHLLPTGLASGKPKIWVGAGPAGGDSSLPGFQMVVAHSVVNGRQRSSLSCLCLQGTSP